MNRLKEQGRFLRNVWLLTKSYWQSEERLKAYLLLTVIIALTLAVVYVIVLINDWFNVFYEALQNYNTVRGAAKLQHRKNFRRADTFFVAGGAVHYFNGVFVLFAAGADY